MTTTVDRGDRVRSTATFTVVVASVATPTDPTVVKCYVMAPDGTTTTYTYGLGSIVKSSTGVYYLDIDVTAQADWRVRWEGTGTVAAVVEDIFSCNATHF